MRKINKFFPAVAALLFLSSLFATSCKQGDDVVVHVPQARTVTSKVAVVLPISQSSDYQTRLKSTVEWALENMAKAQTRLISTFGDTLATHLELEWYDEDKEDLNKLSVQLAKRSDLAFIIGPLRNKNVNVMAKACKETHKPLIVPSASSESVIRRYAVTKSGDKAEDPFLWSLCETDVSQCEALLLTAVENMSKKLALITPDDEYGQTFYEWIPFFAVEMGLELPSDNIKQYTGSDLAEKIKALFSSDAECVICAARTTDEVKTVLEAWKEAKANKSDAPRLLFTNQAFSAALLELGDLAEGAEGMAPYADPTTGFQVAYEERFGVTPSGSDAQVYDAVLLAGIVSYVQAYTKRTDTNEVIRELTSNGTDPYSIWSDLGLSSASFMMRQSSSIVKMVGACGPIRFDSEACTSLVESTYAHWMVYGKKFVTIDFYSTDGNNRTSSISAAWNHKATAMNILVDKDVSLVYEPLKKQKAVLIQGSNGWDNYRHQADVLNMYQMLKGYGWSDDDIILIIADDLVNDSKNIYPGEIRSHSDGPNLYADVKIDYNTDTLTVGDIENILTGVQSKHLPVVLDSDGETNVLLFWSGHGCLKDFNASNNGFVWRKGTIFTDVAFRRTLERMSDENHFRKMLLLLEPCFSRNMAQQADMFPGILAIASASGTESSFADFHSSEMGTWMSDRFSNNLVDMLGSNPNQTYKELYEYLYRHTLGSHVYLENAAYFGNMYSVTPSEFVVRNN